MVLGIYYDKDYDDDREHDDEDDDDGRDEEVDDDDCDGWGSISLGRPCLHIVYVDGVA